MQKMILLTGALASLTLAGCESEKSFDVSGVVPSSEMRADNQITGRPEPAVVKASRRDEIPNPPMQKVERQPRHAPVTFPNPDTIAPPTTSKPPQVTLVPDTELVGKVESVNASLHFVVLNFPAGRMAAVGQQLALYHQGQKIGEVKITGPQQDDNIIADIISGDAEAGDEVR